MVFEPASTKKVKIKCQETVVESYLIESAAILNCDNLLDTAVHALIPLFHSPHLTQVISLIATLTQRRKHKQQKECTRSSKPTLKRAADRAM